MNCPKKCNCLECEMLEQNHIITLIDDTNPFNQKRLSVNGFKCNYTAKCDFDIYALKQSGFNDDLLFTSQNKIVTDYMKAYQKVI